MPSVLGKSEPIAVDGSRPVILGGPGRAWRVESGHVDLFVAPMENDLPAGARHHLLRAEAGALVCSLDLDTAATRMVLVAAGVPGASMREVGWQDLLAGAPSDPTVAALVEGWVGALAQAIALDLRPSGAKPIETGKEQPFAKGDRAIVADGLLLVTPRSGLWAYEDCAEAWQARDTSAPAARLAMPRSTWLRAASDGCLSAAPWREVPTEDADEALRQFHLVAARCLVKKLQRDQEAERQRCQRKAAADLSAFARTLHGLAGSIGASSTLEAPACDTAQDPMLAALARVGAALHVEIRRPARPHPSARYDGGLAGLCEASGLQVRRVRLSGEWWRTYSGPLVGWMNEDRRPAALTRGRSGGYEVHDAGRGSVTPVGRDVASSLSPDACCFYRSFPHRVLTAVDVLRFGLLDCRRDVLMVLLAGVGMGLLGMFSPVLTGVLFDRIIPGAMRGSLVACSVALLTCALASGVFQLVRAFALIRLETRMNASVQAAVWDRVLRAPAAFFRGFNAGDLASRALAIDEIRQVLTGSAIATCLSALFSAFSVALLFYYSWQLAIPALLMVTAACAVTVVLGWRQVRRQRRLAAVQGRIAGRVLQIIGGIAKIRAAGAERRAFVHWGDLFGVAKQCAAAARRTGNTLVVFNGSYPLLCTGLLFLLVFAADGTNDLSTGAFLAFHAAFGQLLASMLALCATLVSAASVVPHYERARPILTTLPEVTADKHDPGEITGAIDVSHVRFRYDPEAPPVLDEVSLNIGAGQFIAIVGPSGCGKSTLFRVLLGFEQPESGAVYYDGQKLSDIDVHALRRQMGVVLQNSRLVSADILTNIIGASAHLTVNDAWEAARLAGLDEDIARMPMGMYTAVSEGGAGLSGGQRQRLLVARALVNRPRVLLFDEATSALDNQTQATVSRSIERLRTTRIVIAHRMSTVQHADRIDVFDRGRIVESGSFDELMRAGGRFATLARRQLA